MLRRTRAIVTSAQHALQQRMLRDRDYPSGQYATQEYNTRMIKRKINMKLSAENRSCVHWSTPNSHRGFASSRLRNRQALAAIAVARENNADCGNRAPRRTHVPQFLIKRRLASEEDIMCVHSEMRDQVHDRCACAKDGQHLETQACPRDLQTNWMPLGSRDSGDASSQQHQVACIVSTSTCLLWGIVSLDGALHAQLGEYSATWPWHLRRHVHS